jgi:hypothetical protein
VGWALVCRNGVELTGPLEAAATDAIRVIAMNNGAE